MKKLASKIGDAFKIEPRSQGPHAMIIELNTVFSQRRNPSERQLQRIVQLAQNHQSNMRKLVHELESQLTRNYTPSQMPRVLVALKILDHCISNGLGETFTNRHSITFQQLQTIMERSDQYSNQHDDSPEVKEVVELARQVHKRIEYRRRASATGLLLTASDTYRSTTPADNGYQHAGPARNPESKILGPKLQRKKIPVQGVNEVVIGTMVHHSERQQETADTRRLSQLSLIASSDTASLTSERVDGGRMPLLSDRSARQRAKSKAKGNTDPVPGTSKPDQYISRDQLHRSSTVQVSPSKSASSIPNVLFAGYLHYKSFDKKPGQYIRKYFWLGTEPTTAQQRTSILASNNSWDARKTAAWSSQTGSGLLFYGDIVNGTHVLEGCLCLANATNYVKPRPDLFGFTISTVNYYFREPNEPLCQERIIAIGRAMNEARHMRHSLESSEGYKEVFDLLQADAKAGTAGFDTVESRPARSSKVQDTRPKPYESDKDSLLGHTSRLRANDIVAPGQALNRRIVESTDRREGDSATSPSFDILNTFRTVYPLRAELTPSNASTAAEDALTMRLNTYFASEDPRQRRYTDVDIQEISSILKHRSPRWSKVPRTYIVLRVIGHLDLLDDCIDIGFSDYWFPVTERSLPDVLRQSVRSAFVEAQQMVMTQSMNLEKGDEGEHCYFRKGDTLPLEPKGVLGRGGYGQVDRVLSLISFKEYARKRVLRSVAFRGRKKEDIKQFIAEIEILKRLKHRHVVEFVGSYTDAKYIGLIMTPIADGDLASYLASATSSTYPELRTFFGCLAMALEFLHDHNVRHKDIKPQNVLVSKGRVLFADFGLSLDFTDATGSTTMSMVNGMTPRYCAPEVANQAARNTSSDIWSLGVVFLEMMATLKSKNLEYVDDFFRQRGAEQPFIRLNATALPELITHLATLGQWTDNKALDWTASMLSVQPKSRPTASALVNLITPPSSEDDSAAFCGICCAVPEEEDFSDYESACGHDDD